MKVTGTFQISSKLHPCPPLPVMHTPARKVKSDTKNKEWRVNPMARAKVQQQLGMTKMTQKYPIAKVRPLQYSNNRVTTQQEHFKTPNSSPSLKVSSPHESNKFGKGGVSAQGEVIVGQNGELQFLMSSNQQNIQKTTPGRHKFDGIRKTQYLSMNNKFSNLTTALNTAYKKSQEQAEKRLKMEKTLQEKTGEVMSC